MLQRFVRAGLVALSLAAVALGGANTPASAAAKSWAGPTLAPAAALNAGTAAQVAAAPGPVGPISPPAPASKAGAGIAAAAGGGCRVTLGISACMDAGNNMLRPDFYVNSLSGLPAGSRYDVLAVNIVGDLWIAKKGILDHTGHYGPWISLNTRAAVYTIVVVSDPSGSIVYYTAASPLGTP